LKWVAGAGWFRYGEASVLFAEPIAVALEHVRIIPRHLRPMSSAMIARGVSLFRKLVCENVELVNLRRFGKQITCVRFFH
jgi:hypothetical protein